MAEKFDPSTWDDDTLDKIVLSIAQTDGRSMPNLGERQAVFDEYRRRGRNGSKTPPHLAKPKEPENVTDNLAASATPVTETPKPSPKPAVKPSQQRALLPGQSMDDYAVAHRQELQDTFDAGMKTRRARLANGTVEPLPAEAEYNAATGHPDWTYDEDGNPAQAEEIDAANTLSDGRVWNGHRYVRPMATEAQIESPAPLGYTAPGPRTLDGKPPAPRRPLGTPEEVEAYSARPEDGLSQQDADMKARGLVPVVTPDGVRYMVNAQNDSGPIPGGPGRAGARPDLLGNVGLQYEPQEMVGPDGKSVQVLRPNAKSLEAANAKAQPYHDRVAKDKAERRKRWQATAYLAGGSQNLNSGNRWIANALVDMTPEERNNAMRYMLPGADRHALVDAQNMQNANDVIKRFMTSGAAAGMNNPVAAAALQQQQLQGQQEMIKWAEDNINDNYAWDDDTWLPGSSFTSGERDQAINDLMDRYGPPNGTLTLADATRIVDNIGQRKPQSTSRPAPSRPGMPDSNDGGGIGTPM